MTKCGRVQAWYLTFVSLLGQIEIDKNTKEFFRKEKADAIG